VLLEMFVLILWVNPPKLLLVITLNKERMTIQLTYVPRDTSALKALSVHTNKAVPMAWKVMVPTLTLDSPIVWTVKKEITVIMVRRYSAQLVSTVMKAYLHP